jgi:lysophospholipase L1-like esterase
VFVGDSTTANYDGANDNLNMWPRVLRNLLVGSGAATHGGTGQVPAAAAGSIDPRWSFTSMANNTTYSSGGAGAVATFSTATNGNETGTSFVGHFLGDSGTFTVTVDGAIPASGNVTLTGGSTYSAGTVTPDGSAVDRTITISGLSDTTHTVVFTRTAGTMKIASGGLRRTAGLIAHNLGESGTSAHGTGQWDDATGALVINRQAIAPAAPDAVFIALGANDFTAGNTTTQIKNGYNTVRGYWPNADVFLVACVQRSSVSQANWEDYVTKLYDLADTLDCPLLDLYWRTGGYTTANANGLMGDTIHPSKAGQQAWASAVAGAVSEASGDIRLAPIQGVRTVAATGGIPGAIHAAVSVPAVVTAFNYYVPFGNVETISLTKAVTEVTTASSAGGKASLALYTASPDLQPVSLVVDFGEVTIDTTGVKTWTLSSPVGLTRGRYLMLFRISANASFRALYYSCPGIPPALLALGANPYTKNYYIAAAYTSTAPATAPAHTGHNTSNTAGFEAYATLGWTVAA